MSTPPSGELWTIQRILAWTQTYFAEKGVASPRLDAEVLLADTLGVNRIYLYTHFDKPLEPGERERFRERIKRRAAREPVAYILGRREFYGRDFRVTPAVLVPRPETEHLVDAVVDWVRAAALQRARILDLGTGSGAIAVTLACELAEARLTAVDTSAAALAVARGNAEAHGVAERVELCEGDLYAPVAGRRFDVVAANPPYVAAAVLDSLEPEVRCEPRQALDGGEGGLAVLSRLVAAAAEHLERPGLLAIEIGFDQLAAVSDLVAQASCFAPVRHLRDLQGHARVVLAELRGGAGPAA